MDPQKYDGILRYLASASASAQKVGKEVRIWPDDVKGKIARNNFRRYALSFVVGPDGELRKVVRDGCDPVRVVCGDDEKRRVLDAIHGHDVGGGHLGVNKTFVKIAERYWWRGFHDDVREYVGACDKCQCNNAIKKVHEELHPVPFSDRPFDTWGMDLVGPLPETPRGNKYIMTVTNYLTRWANAYAIPDKRAETVCECLGDLICDYGVPERIISDQGKEFLNGLNDELCCALQIKRSICTAYHPQSNGLTERFNQTLERVLAKMVDDDQSCWDRKLKWAVFSYRSSEQASLKKSPFYMMYGVSPRLPIEVDNMSTKSMVRWEDTYSSELQESIERRLQVLIELPVIPANGTVRLEGMKSLHSTSFLKHFIGSKDEVANEKDDDVDVVTIDDDHPAEDAV